MTTDPTTPPRLSAASETDWKAMYFNLLGDWARVSEYLGVEAETAGDLIAAIEVRAATLTAAEADAAALRQALTLALDFVDRVQTFGRLNRADVRVPGPMEKAAAVLATTLRAALTPGVGAERCAWVGPDGETCPAPKEAAVHLDDHRVVARYRHSFTPPPAAEPRGER